MSFSGGCISDYSLSCSYDSIGTRTLIKAPTNMYRVANKNIFNRYFPQYTKRKLKQLDQETTYAQEDGIIIVVVVGGRQKQIKAHSYAHLNIGP